MIMDLRISIPEKMFSDISLAPKDGRIIYVADSDGNVDLARWDDGWTAEQGTCSHMSKWAPISICLHI